MSQLLRVWAQRNMCWLLTQTMNLSEELSKILCMLCATKPEDNGLVFLMKGLFGAVQHDSEMHCMTSRRMISRQRVSVVLSRSCSSDVELNVYPNTLCVPELLSARSVTCSCERPRYNNQESWPCSWRTVEVHLPLSVFESEVE